MMNKILIVIAAACMLVFPVMAEEFPCNKDDLAQIQQAAEKGNVDAQICLGDLYLYGKIYPYSDRANALKWYKLAAEQGNAVAENKVGVNTFDGCKDSIKWYNLAIEHGNTDAINNLAWLYWDGALNECMDYRQDIDNAVKLWTKAAELGNPHAQDALANYYNDYTDNKDEALKLYELACNNGLSASCLTLSKTYELGSGVKKDSDKSYFWYKKWAKTACNEGYEAACLRLKGLNY